MPERLMRDVEGGGIDFVDKYLRVLEGGCVAIMEAATPLAPNVSLQTKGELVSSSFDSIRWVSSLTCTASRPSYHESSYSSLQRLS